MAAGDDLAQLPRPVVVGDGRLLELRKVEQPTEAQAVNVTNWAEGADALADAFGKLLGPMFERLAANTDARNRQPMETASESAANGDTAKGEAEGNKYDVPQADEYDARVAWWIGKRIYLGQDTQIARLFWLLTKPVGRAHSLGHVQRAIEGMETNSDVGSTPAEIEKAGKRVRKVVAKLRAAMREAELDAHFLIHRGGTQNEPEYSLIPRFPTKGSGVPGGR